MPSVLVETGFVSNPSDAEVLMDDKELEKMGQAIAQGIMATLQ